MGRCRFVDPEVVRLPLSDGDWIEVKKTLNVGEERAAFQLIAGEVKDGWRRVNYEMLGIAEVLAYIVDWSLVDKQGKVAKVTLSAIQQLDPATFKEIEDALKKHEAAMDAEREARKNDLGGGPASSPTSPSARG